MASTSTRHLTKAKRMNRAAFAMYIDTPCPSISFFRLKLERETVVIYQNTIKFSGPLQSGPLS
jgi:hypothetical protein